MLGAMCVHVNISAASVYDVERQIKSKKTARKEFKVYGIKIVRIFLGSYRIPNMVLQMSSVLDSRFKTYLFDP